MWGIELLLQTLLLSLGVLSSLLTLLKNKTKKTLSVYTAKNLSVFQEPYVQELP